MTRVLVVYGGFGLSDEAEVSEASGMEIVKAIEEADMVPLEFRLTLENLHLLVQDAKAADMVFPILHGDFGESGEIQKILEDAHIKYLGSGVEASRLCWDKYLYKQKLQEIGITTPAFRLITSDDEVDGLELPIVLKIRKGGSSIGVLILKDEAQKVEAKELLAKHGELMAEEYIEGTEITVGVLGEETLPIIEIRPPEGRWYDYEMKYGDEVSLLVSPEDLPEDLQRTARELALKIHKALGCRHISRTDMIIRNGKIFVLETNTLPGTTSHSLFTKAAPAAGYDMPALVKKFAELVMLEK